MTISVDLIIFEKFFPIFIMFIESEIKTYLFNNDVSENILCYLSSSNDVAQLPASPHRLKKIAYSELHPVIIHETIRPNIFRFRTANAMSAE